ncbi:glycosyltransferase family 4 protein [Paraferrimonas haliotis]|uniref:Glycosyl transferase family 1 n=1 Tax=Paraferrimonas haliotis TaxID=2013866 RepID=A0AA37TV03_9GAMM|nr:glycosyltransferase family 4 protein [Paraferrimonas haliotis]GLS83110.1 glycosyl transferase family 1 [Paraferrimonas haliotis]
MSKVFIIQRNLFDKNGHLVGFGGIEKYILDLAQVLTEQAYQVCFIQSAKEDFEFEKDGYQVIGVHSRWLRGNLRKYALVKQAKALASAGDIIIFASDSYAIPVKGIATIAIQHGVSWDKPHRASIKMWQYFNAIKRSLSYLNKAQQADTLICVDHNFVNWHRTWANLSGEVEVIYNYYDQAITEAAFEKKWAKTNPLKVIIARRFVDYRGVGDVAPALHRLLARYPNIELTLAGNGPQLPQLQQLFASNSRVSFTTYEPQQSFDVHQQHHIAIVPTLGSEGTSLALIEAMAAGCCVVCSNVGGLSNIVVDNFNGKMLVPSADNFETALAHLFETPKDAQNLAIKGLQTVQMACSKARWGQSWLTVIEKAKAR